MPRARTLSVPAFAFALLVLGCTSAATRSDDGEIVEPGSLSVFSMHTGDCFDDPDDLAPEGMEINSVGAVPCAEPHDNEVFAVYALPGGPITNYPGDDEMYVRARDECVDRFAEYVGIDYLDSRLEVDPITPTRASWEEDGDREVVCFLYDLWLAPLTGSMRGAAE